MSENQVRETENQEEEYTIDLKVLMSDIWRGFVKFWWIGAVLMLLLGGWQFYRRYVHYTPMYQSSATFTVQTESSREDDSGYAFYYNSSMADQLQMVFPYVFNNAILRDQVCADLGLPYMPASVAASCVEGTNLITLSSSGSDPQLVYDVLLSVIDNYSSVADYIIGNTQLSMINEPEVAKEPYNAFAWKKSVMKGVLMGAFLGFGWIVLYAVLRRTIRTKEEIHTVLNQKCLGTIPHVTFKKHRKQIDQRILITNRFVGKDFLEAVRVLRSVMKNHLSQDEKAVMVTSTAPNEGKTVVTVNLAAMSARGTDRVLVIDADLRKGDLENMLRDETDCSVVRSEEKFVIRHYQELNFDLLTFKNGEKDGHKILRTSYFKPLVREMKENYDLILIDTPPCGMISDPLIVAGAADAALYVVHQDEVLVNSIKNGIQTLKSGDAKVLGCVLTGATGGLGGYGNYYSYGGYHKYYRYGYSRSYEYK